MGEENALERENCRGLALTDQMQQIAERMTEKLIRQQVDIGETEFCFMPGYETTNTMFILRHSYNRNIQPQRICNLFFLDLAKAFD